MIGIWSRVVKFDSTTQEDVVKDRALSHFIRHLSWGLPRFQSNPATTATTSSLEDASEQRTMAAFIMAVICSGYPLGQAECINEKLHITICSLLQSLESPDDSEREDAEANMSYQFRMWLIICLGNLSKDNAAAQTELFKSGLHFRLLERLDDDSPNVRTASCYALGCMIGSVPYLTGTVSVTGRVLLRGRTGSRGRGRAGRWRRGRSRARSTRTRPGSWP